MPVTLRTRARLPLRDRSNHQNVPAGNVQKKNPSVSTRSTASKIHNDADVESEYISDKAPPSDEESISEGEDDDSSVRNTDTSSSEDDDNFSVNSMEVKMPPVQPKKRKKAATTPASLPIFSLRCVKSIKAHHPTPIQPPPTYRTSMERLHEFVSMNKEEQKNAKKIFTAYAKSKKVEILASIPGEDCVCCVRKTRCDAGKS